MKPQKYIRSPRIVKNFKDNVFLGTFNIYEYGKFGDMYELDLSMLRRLSSDLNTYLSEIDERSPFQEIEENDG